MEKPSGNFKMKQSVKRMMASAKSKKHRDCLKNIMIGAQITSEKVNRQKGKDNHAN